MTRQRRSEDRRLKKSTLDPVTGNNFSDFFPIFMTAFNKRQVLTCFDDQRV